MIGEIERVDRQSFALPEALSHVSLQRLAWKAVNHLGPSIVEVAVEPRAGDKVAIVLPGAWAYIFLAHLEATAKQIQEELHRAMYQAKLKDSRIQVKLDEAALEWEAERGRIRERYAQLLNTGLPKRDAIRRIKAESGGNLTATIIADVVGNWDPRVQRRREARDARIRTLRAEGRKLHEIASEVGVSKWTVKAVLKRQKGGRDGENSD